MYKHPRTFRCQAVIEVMWEYSKKIKVCLKFWFINSFYDWSFVLDNKITYYRKWKYYYLDVTPDLQVKLVGGQNNDTSIHSPLTGWKNWPINEFRVGNLNWRHFFPWHYIHLNSTSIIIVSLICSVIKKITNFIE